MSSSASTPRWTSNERGAFFPKVIDFFTAIFVIGFLIILLEVATIIVWWRKGNKYLRMQLAYSEMTRQLRILEQRLRAPPTMRVVADDHEDNPPPIDPVARELPIVEDPEQREEPIHGP